MRTRLLPALASALAILCTPALARADGLPGGIIVGFLWMLFIAALLVIGAVVALLVWLGARKRS